MVFHHDRLRVRPLATRRLRGEPESSQRHQVRRGLHAARHHGFLGQSDQGAIDEPRRADPIARGRRHDQLPQAGGAIRARQEIAHRRRAAGARSERGSAAQCVVRRLGVRVVLEAAGVPHVEEFVADIRKKSGGKVPTARTWFGYTAIWTCKLAADKAKSLEPIKLAKAMQGLTLPPEVALMPNNPYYRIGDNQLMPTLFVGQSQPAPQGGDPEDLFKVTQLVKGDEAALPVDQTGCKMEWPS